MNSVLIDNGNYYFLAYCKTSTRIICIYKLIKVKVELKYYQERAVRKYCLYAGVWSDRNYTEAYQKKKKRSETEEIEDWDVSIRPK